MGDYKESNTLQDHILSLSQERRPRSFFEGRRRLYKGHLWIADVNRVPVYNCINYFCLFFLWQLKRCWQTTTLIMSFTTQDRHMKPVYRSPLMSVHRLAAKLFAISTLKSKYKISNLVLISVRPSLLFTISHRQRTDAPTTGTAIKKTDRWSHFTCLFPESRNTSKRR